MKQGKQSPWAEVALTKYAVVTVSLRSGVYSFVGEVLSIFDFVALGRAKPMIAAILSLFTLNVIYSLWFVLSLILMN